MLQDGRSRVRVPMSWNFSSFQPHYGPGFDSASNRNEYQESSLGGKGRPSLKSDNLTSICLEKVGASTSHNPMDIHDLLQGSFTFYIVYLIVIYLQKEQYFERRSKNIHAISKFRNSL
jgi:hypothetical protein